MMNFERGKDLKTQMGIGIIEKYRKVLNEVAQKYSQVVMDGEEIWRTMELEIEQKMEWERGTIRITRLKDQYGINIAVTNKEVRDEIRKRERSQGKDESRGTS